MALCDEKVTEELKCVILFNSLPASYNSIRKIFECTGTELTLKKLLEVIKAKEGRLGACKPEQEAMLAKWKPHGEGNSKNNIRTDGRKAKTRGQTKLAAKSAFTAAKKDILSRNIKRRPST